MKNSRNVLQKLLVLTLLWPLAGHSENQASLTGDLAPSGNLGLAQGSAFLGTGSQTYTLPLPDIADTLPQAPSPGPHQTGTVYPLDAPVGAGQLAWEPVLGGYVARVHLLSSQAKRLRIHLANLAPSSPAEFRVQGNLDLTPFGPVGSTSVRNDGLWLPVSNGNSADLEIFVDASVALDTLGFKLDAVNLIVEDVAGGDVAGIVAQRLGLTQYPELDYACWSGSNDIGQGLAQAAGATAKISFISAGASYSCSGTLLNDKLRTRTPWFATAYHCIHNQATADTATFEWYFQATTCGGSARDPRYAQTSGGAQLLWSGLSNDVAFLKLDQQPPSNAVFISWDTGIRVGDLVWGVHHPKGDHTMVSEGKVTALQKTVVDSDTGGSLLLDDVTFFSGGTEAGSSGSGLFYLAGPFAYWRGTLFGGPANNYQLASYSHLNNYYNQIKPWLENLIALPVPTVTLTASPTVLDYQGSTTVNWSSTYATACNATISDGWSGAVPLSGTIAVSPAATVTYSLFCSGSGGNANQSVTVTVNPPATRLINCLFDWAQRQYPTLLYPFGTPTQTTMQYTYRFYPVTNAFVGVSSANNHVYYSAKNVALQDLGELSTWLTKAACR
jgi:hypothetical protein